jgi:hypothetical protein
MDDKTCDLCEEMDGKEFPISVANDLFAPHCFCRRTLLYIGEGESNWQPTHDADYLQSDEMQALIQQHGHASPLFENSPKKEVYEAHVTYNALIGDMEDALEEESYNIEEDGTGDEGE